MVSDRGLNSNSGPHVIIRKGEDARRWKEGLLVGENSSHVLYEQLDSFCFHPKVVSVDGLVGRIMSGPSHSLGVVSVPYDNRFVHARSFYLSRSLCAPAAEAHTLDWDGHGVAAAHLHYVFPIRLWNNQENLDACFYSLTADLIEDAIFLRSNKGSELL